MADLAALVVRLQADASSYMKALDQATAKLDKFAKDQETLASRVGDKLKEIGSGIAAAFAVERLVEFTSQAIETQAQLEKMSQITGISVQSLAGLNLAFTAAGLGSDETEKAFRKLNSAISDAGGDETSKAGAAFKTMGINVKDANGNLKDAATVQNEVADYFAKTADGANKVALAIALFGRAGEAMIPTLNQGAAGLAEYQKQAEAWGLAISDDAAKAAEELEKKMRALRAELVGNLSAQISAQLVPALNSIFTSMAEDKSAVEAFHVVAVAVGVVFKVIAGAIIIVVDNFKILANTALSVGRAIEDLITTFSFVKAGGDLADGSKAATKNFDDMVASVLDLAKAGTAADDSLNKVVDTAKKPDAGSLKETEAQNAAIKKLQELRDELNKQTASFGLGEAALVSYRLKTGDLAKDMAAAGDAAKKLGDDITKAAAQLQFQKDNKAVNDFTRTLQEQVDKLDQSDAAAFRYKITTGALGDEFTRLGAKAADARAKATALNNELIDDKDRKAVQALNDEIEKTRGKLVDAGTAAFDLQEKALKQNLSDRAGQGDAEAAKGLEVLAMRREQIAVIDQYNQLVAQGASIEADFAERERQLQVLRTQGSITSLDYDRQLNDARVGELAQLNQIYTAEKQISDGAGKDIPELTQKTKQFDAQIQQLGTTTNQLEKDIRGKLEDAFANSFLSLETGATSFKKAFSDMAKSIERDLLSIANKNIAESIFGTGGSAGGAAGFLASLFGQSGLSSGSSINASVAAASAGSSSILGNIGVGSLVGAAGGGVIPAGKLALVGEEGPELMYNGAENTNVIPNGALNGGKSLNVTNHFTIQAPGGTISRQSQMQTAAAAARSLQMASRRNNT